MLRGGCRLGGGGRVFIQNGNHSIRDHGFALTNGMARDNTGGWCRNLQRDLVGFEFGHSLISGDTVTDILEPSRDGRLGNRFTKRGDDDFNGHDVFLFRCFVASLMVEVKGFPDEFLLFAHVPGQAARGG